MDILFWLCYDYDWWLKSNDIDKYMIKLSHGKSKYDYVYTMTMIYAVIHLWYYAYVYMTMSMSMSITMSMMEDVNDVWYHMFV